MREVQGFAPMCFVWRSAGLNFFSFPFYHTHTPHGPRALALPFFFSCFIVPHCKIYRPSPLLNTYNKTHQYVFSLSYALHVGAYPWPKRKISLLAIHPPLPTATPSSPPPLGKHSRQCSGI